MDWKRFFGIRREKPESKGWPKPRTESGSQSSTLPERPPEVRKRGRLETELPLEPRPIPEAKEKPRVIQAGQMNYGKMHEYEGGPIVKGSEYHPTGYSEGCRGVANAVGAKFAGILGFTDQLNARAYPWINEGGGIAKMTAADPDGRRYIVCGRHNYLSEKGDSGQGGRMYGEDQFFLIPAEEWSVAVVPQLADELEVHPHTVGETDAERHAMPKVEISTQLLDNPLPSGWYSTEIKELLTAALSGEPVQIQDWDIPVKTFLNKMFYVLSCLPESVARQISFGSGLSQMGGGDAGIPKLRIGQGMEARTAYRKTGGQWRTPLPEDDPTVKEYILELEIRIGNCATPRDILKAVLTISPHLLAKVEKQMLGA